MLNFNRYLLAVLSILFLLLMHIFIPNVGGVIAQPREFLIWIGIFTIILLSVTNILRNKALVLPSYRTYILLFVALLLSSSIFNPIKNIDMFVINALLLVAAVLLWLGLHQFNLKEREKETLLLIIFASVVIESIIGIMQFFGLYKYIPITPAPEVGMVGGAFQQKNLFASWMAIGLIISLYFITTDRFKNYHKTFMSKIGTKANGNVIARDESFLACHCEAVEDSRSNLKTGSEQAPQSQKARFLATLGMTGGGIKVLFLSCVALLSLSLIIAGSRTGLIGTGLAMTVIFTPHLCKGAGFTSRVRQYLKKGAHGGNAVSPMLLAWLMVFFIGTAGGYSLLSVKDKLGIEKLTVKQIEWFSDIKQPSYVHRILMCKTSFEMLKEKPIFGQGFSNFGSLYMYHQAKVVKSEPEYKKLIGNYTSHPHNEIFRIMAESGIAGILAILIAVAGFVRMLYKLGLQRAGLYTAILMPLLAHMMFEYPLELSTSHYLVFLIFLYMATSHFVEEKRLNLRKSAAVLTIFVSLIMYICVSGYTMKTFYDYMNMVIYYKEHEEGKTPSEINIKGAANNIYLQNWARPMYMSIKAEDAAKDVAKNIDFLNDFLKWSSLEKQRQPLKMVFYNDAVVLYSMGIYFKQLVYFDEAMKTVEEGMSLYPNDGSLKAMRLRIVSEAFKAIFQGFQQR
ncbi:MAG: Wzy polymerase domain-containing protein [Nitrospirota bacterium]